MLSTGETPYIFLLTGISNVNIFFVKNMKNMVVYNNIHDKFGYAKLTYNLKKRKEKKKTLHKTLHKTNN